MKKSLLALALLGAFAGAAQAQSSVVIYGGLDAGMIKRTDQTLNIGKRMNNFLGFKGQEDLGNGIKAVFQLETRFEPDTGTIESSATGIQRPLFQGQSRVGLTGAFGTVRLGRGLTAYQETSIAFEPFHGIPTPQGFQADLMVGGYQSDPLGLAGNSLNRFSNALFYNSPEIGGWTINTTIGTREANNGLAIIGRGTAAAPQYAAGAMASATPYSLSTVYKTGPAAMMLAFERNAIETRLFSIAGSLMASPDLKLMASMTRKNENHTLATNYRTDAWVVGANYTMGAGKVLAGFGMKSPDGTGKTRQMSLGYEYSLSKRTYLYVDGSRRTQPTGTTTINTYAVGVNHSF
jgi:predicted porin